MLETQKAKIASLAGLELRVLPRRIDHHGGDTRVPHRRAERFAAGRDRQFELGGADVQSDRDRAERRNDIDFPIVVVPISSAG